MDMFVHVEASSAALKLAEASHPRVLKLRPLMEPAVAASSFKQGGKMPRGQQVPVIMRPSSLSPNLGLLASGQGNRV